MNMRSQKLREVTELDKQGDAEEVEGIWDRQGCSEMIQHESVKGGKVMKQGKVEQAR